MVIGGGIGNMVVIGPNGARTIKSPVSPRLVNVAKASPVGTFATPPQKLPPMSPVPRTVVPVGAPRIGQRSAPVLSPTIPRVPTSPLPAIVQPLPASLPPVPAGHPTLVAGPSEAVSVGLDDYYYADDEEEPPAPTPAPTPAPWTPVAPTPVRPIVNDVTPPSASASAFPPWVIGAAIAGVVAVGGIAVFLIRRKRR